VSAVEDARAERERLTPLLRLGARLARRLSASKGMLYYEDELCGVAWSALARALSGYDADRGELTPYAAAWMAGEVRSALDAEQKRAKREVPVEDAEAVRSGHPLLRSEELGGDLVHELLSIYVGEELGSQGDADLLTREAFAALHREIALLDAEDQRLVALRYWDGRTWDEVAAALAVAEPTARHRDARIREQLRDRLIAWETVRPLRRGGR
jgi:RNA polymerase sigma factor (sigma-70 family)